MRAFFKGSLVMLMIGSALAGGCGDAPAAPAESAEAFQAQSFESFAKSSSSQGSSQSCGKDKVNICHLEGNGSYHDICVSPNALSAHEGHGDPSCACGDTSLVYPDRDRDGYGDSAVEGQRVCAVPAGYVTNTLDCDDANGAINPTAIEVCDSVDNDCDGLVDNTDEDGDGFSPCDAALRDCDDFRDTVGPGAVERCDGIDDDCDGIVDNDFDADGDGFSACEGDCQDDDPARYPALTDGWQEHLCNPILPNTPGKDSLYTDQASILVDESSVDARYKAWYRYGDTVNTRIAHAVSADGITWRKLGVVLERGAAGEFDDSRLVYPTVLFRDGLYHMWYAGYRDATAAFAIGYAVSQDGLAWTKVDGDPATSANDPVVAPANNGYDSRSAQAPSVLYRDGLFLLWYGATDKATPNLINVALATSTDGVKWKKRGVVLPVVAGTWESLRVNFPRVMDNGEYFEMLYSGSDVGGSVNRVGYARSYDGVTWERFGVNPVMTTTGIGWNAFTVYSPSPVVELGADERELYRVYLGGGASSAGPLQTGLYTNYLPLVTMVAPAQASVFTAADTLPVRVHVDDPREASRIDLRLYHGSSELAAGRPDAQGYLSFPVKLPAGNYTLTVVARDSGGLRSSDSVSVTVTN